ncbi:MAG: TIGR03862 family flavoprotein [Prolixibacteraceae bacterium]|nr:TIGR03862 family flavoprotein [Burkholderiales bacterium]
MKAVVIGGGPAGLMAAEVLSGGGAKVDLYDSMPSLGRKFLMAGKGGLNLTHAEAHDPFLARYGSRRANIEPLLNAFGPDALRGWLRALGVETFVGTSGRIFPIGMKAAPLLRAWLHRLRRDGASIHVRHRWLGWTQDGALRFASPHGEHARQADVVILALGGGSWARLGSDAAWVPLLEQRGVRVAPLQPSNCGFDIGWSEHFRSRFAGQPLKSVVACFTDSAGITHQRQGECIITDTGIEGGLVYALSAPLRHEIAVKGAAVLHLDLLPGREPRRVLEEITHPRGAKSLSTHLQSHLGIKGVKAGLLREAVPKEDFADLSRLATALKALPLRLVSARPMDEAISTAGGVAFEALDEQLMIRNVPGVFCAGEMLDWEAPTGGYLLTACFASGRAAGAGALAWLERQGRQNANSPTET